jgi:hypothetical protein
MPRTKKAAGQAVDRRNGRQAELQVAEATALPPVPTGLKRDESVALWSAYWGDAIAGLVQPAEIALVERWVRNVDRYRVLMDVADAEPLVEGSMGQMRANPAYDLALKIEAAITRDEAQLGYGPKNRAALGIAVVQQKASLADLNDRYGGGMDGSHHAEEEDPRLSLAE